jgi:hypothetical protein
MILKKISIGKRPFFGVCYISRKITEYAQLFSVLDLDNVEFSILKREVIMSKILILSNQLLSYGPWTVTSYYALIKVCEVSNNSLYLFCDTNLHANTLPKFDANAQAKAKADAWLSTIALPFL